ncbi:LSU ribosomal protein L25p [hydrothermal vent metagenome]|uniref:LSU ribosomal protein L25p n=1 Tax=hydrothermal vent metagenome TaxID=652676 RepID=A0A3B1D1V1_9ZZZZ
MEEIKLDVQIRNKIGTRRIKGLRREGFLPAVVYGGKRGPTTIKVDRRIYEKTMRLYRGQSVVFYMTVLEGEKKIRDYSTIVKEEQLDPVSDKLVHIDFKRIDLKEKLEIKVSLVSKGEAIGVKQDKGSLDHAMWELEVFCLPTNIPKKIEVDVSVLGIGDVIYVKDIVLPDGVITNHDPESIVFSVVPPMKEEAPTEEEAEPEVTKEKKGDEKKEEGKA